MGDSYKGLTIRIGADTMEFQKAMAGIMKAASNAQTELTRIGKALKLDPNATDSMEMKVRLLSERLQAAAAKMTELRNAERALDAQGIAEAARQTENVSMRLGQASQRFDDLNARIENVRKAMQALAREQGLNKLANERDVISIANGILRSKKATDEARASAARLAEQYKELVPLQREAQAELSTASSVAQLRDLQVEMQIVAAESRNLVREMTALRAATSVISSQSSEFRAMRDQMEMAGTAAKALEEELRRIDGAVRIDPSSIEAVVMRQRDLREAARLAREELEAARKQLAELSKSVDMRGAEKSLEGLHLAYEKAKAGAADAEAAAKSLEGELESLRAREKKLSDQSIIGLDVAKELDATRQRIKQLEAELPKMRSAAERAFAEFETKEAQAQVRALQTRIVELTAKVRQLESTGSALGNIGAIMRNLGTSLSATLTPAIVMAGSRLIGYAEDIDTAFRAMKKTVNASSEEVFEDLRKTALEYSMVHATSADTLLDMQALGGQMGIAADALADFGRVASNLDIATDIDAEDIALYMGQFANITHMSTEEFESFSDSLVRLGNNMPAQESAIMAVAMRIGSMGTIIGMSQSEILAWSAAIAATGQKSEAAGTAMSRTMSNIEQAVGSGGETLELFAQVAGTSATRFATLWQKDPTQALREFVLGLKAIDDAGGSVDATLANLGINGVRQKQALLGLTQTVGLLGDALEMSGDAWSGVADQWGDAGDAAREAGVRSEGFSGALKLLANNAGVLGAEIGDSLEPVIRAFAAGIGGLARAYSELDGPQRLLITAFVAMAAAGGPLLRMFGSLSDTLSNIAPQLKAAATEYRALAVAQTADTASQAASVAANDVSAAAKTRNAIAAGVLTAASGAATVATKALNFALKAMPLIAVASAVVTLVTSIAGFVKSAREASYMSDEFNQKVDQLGKSAQEASRQTGESIATATQAIDKSAASAVVLGDLGREYNELAGIEERSEAQEARLARVKSDLMVASDELADALGREGDESAEARRRIEELAKAEAARMVQSAQEKAYDELQERRLDLMADQLVAEEALAEARRRLTESGVFSDSESNDLLYRLSEGMDQNLFVGDQVRAFRTAYEAARQYGDSLEEVNSRLDGMADSVGEDRKRMAELNEAVRRFRINGGDAEGAVEGLGISVSDLSTELDRLNMQMEIASDEARDELAESLSSIIGVNRHVTEAIGSSKESYDAIVGSMMVFGMSAEELGSYLDDLAAKATNAFDTIEMGSVSIEEAYAAMQENAAATVYLRDMMTELWQSTAYSMNQEFMEAVRSNPEQYYAIIEEMVAAAQSGDEQLIAEIQTFIDSYSENAQLAAQAGVAEMEAAAPAYEAAGRSAIESASTAIADGADDAAISAETVANSAVEALSAGETGAYGQGENFASGYAQGIANGSDMVATAAGSLVMSALAQIVSVQDSHSPSKKSRRLGNDFGEGYGVGIEDELLYIKRMSARAVETASDALSRASSYKYAENAGSIAMDAYAARNMQAYMPYAAMQGQFAQSGDVYNVYINDARINDDDAIRTDVINLLLDAKRAGDM